MGFILSKRSTPNLTISNPGPVYVETRTACPRFTEEQEKLENGWEYQEDVHLLKLIRCKWINPPSKGQLNLDGVRNPWPGFGQSEIVDKILRKRTGEVFTTREGNVSQILLFVALLLCYAKYQETLGKVPLNYQNV